LEDGIPRVLPNPASLKKLYKYFGDDSTNGDNFWYALLMPRGSQSWFEKFSKVQQISAIKARGHVFDPERMIVDNVKVSFLRKEGKSYLTNAFVSEVALNEEFRNVVERAKLVKNKGDIDAKLQEIKDAIVRTPKKNLGWQQVSDEWNFEQKVSSPRSSPPLRRHKSSQEYGYKEEEPEVKKSPRRGRGGCSNAAKHTREGLAPEDFCGPEGGSCSTSFPINTPGRAHSALGRAHFAPNPEGIKACVCREAERRGFFHCHDKK